MPLVESCRQLLAENQTKRRRLQSRLQTAISSRDLEQLNAAVKACVGDSLVEASILSKANAVLDELQLERESAMAELEAAVDGYTADDPINSVRPDEIRACYDRCQALGLQDVLMGKASRILHARKAQHGIIAWQAEQALKNNSEAELKDAINKLSSIEAEPRRANIQSDCTQHARLLEQCVDALKGVRSQHVQVWSWMAASNLIPPKPDIPTSIIKLLAAAATCLVDYHNGLSGNDACAALLWRSVQCYRWDSVAARSAYGYKPGSPPTMPTDFWC